MIFILKDIVVNKSNKYEEIWSKVKDLIKKSDTETCHVAKYFKNKTKSSDFHYNELP